MSKRNGYTRIKISSSVKRVGIIGCGAIGSFLAKKIDKDFKAFAKIAGICDVDKKTAKSLSGRLSKKAPVLSLDELIKRSDLIIEAASGSVSAQICEAVIKKSKDINLMLT